MVNERVRTIRPNALTDWPRPYFERPGGKPFLFYAAYGEVHSVPEIDARSYRTLGVPPGLVVSRYEREKYPEVLSGFEQGYLRDELVARDPSLARRVSESGQCLILRGELEDQADLN